MIGHLGSSDRLLQFPKWRCMHTFFDIFSQHDITFSPSGDLQNFVKRSMFRQELVPGYRLSLPADHKESSSM